MAKFVKIAAVLILAASVCFSSAAVASAQTVTYQKINSIEELTDGRYIIVCENVDNSVYVYNGAMSGSFTEINSDGDKITGDNLCEVEIAEYVGGYSVKLLGGENAGKYIGNTDGQNSIAFSDSPLVNSIEFDGGLWKIGSNGQYLRCRNNKLLRYYDSESIGAAGNEPVVFYKRIGGTDTPTPVQKKVTLSQSVSAGNGSTVSEDGTTIYLQKNGIVQVTYSVSQNDGINSLLFTASYNKTLFAVDSVDVARLFGADSVVTTGNETAADEFKVFAEGDGAGWNATATGKLITISYKFLGADSATFNASDVFFAAANVQCLVNSAGGATSVDCDFADESQQIVFDLRQKPQITASTQNVTYSGREITAGKGETYAVSVNSSSNGAMTCVWYSDETCKTTVVAKNAGTYYLKVVVSATSAFEQTEQVFKIIVNPFNLFASSSEIKLSTDAVQYTGEPVSLTASKVNVSGGKFAEALAMDVAADIYTVRVEQNSFVNEGEPSVRAWLDLGGNYVYNDGSGDSRSVEKTVILNIVLFANSWTVEPISVKKDFDGKGVILSNVAAMYGTPEFTVNGASVSLQQIDNAIVNAGVYTVVVSVCQVGYEILQKTITVSIDKLSLFVPSSLFDYGVSGKVSWTNPTKAQNSLGNVVDFPSGHEPTFSYKILGNSVGNEFVATADGSFVFVVVPSSDNYSVAEVALKQVFAVTFAEGVHSKTDDKGVVGDAYSAKYVFDGQSLVAPVSPTVIGYDFVDWYADDKIFDFDKITASADLTATWQIKSYTVIWDWADKTPSTTKTTNVEYKSSPIYNSTFGVPSKTDASGKFEYAFAGWSIAGKDLPSDYVVTSDVTITAKYTQTQVVFTLTFSVEDTNQSGTLSVRYGTVLSSVEGIPQDGNYIWFSFDGWYTDDFATKIDVMPQNDVTVSARYVYNVVNGDVDGNGSVDTGDVVLYRRYIVGGYKLTVVSDEQEAWRIALEQKTKPTNEVFFHVAAANVDNDAENITGVRDVAVLRMALVGGYGYVVDDEKGVAEGNGNTLSLSLPQIAKSIPVDMFTDEFFGKRKEQ